jgi:hypothetical protein
MLCQRPYLLQKQHKNYILYSLLLLYLLIIIKQRYGKAEQQSFRAAEVCTKPPFWTRPLCTTTPCPLQDEAPLHSCSMPPFGRGPSALLLHASIWTRPFCTTAPCPLQDEAPSARTFLLQIKPSAEPTTLHAERHCKQTIITYQHMKLSCNIQLEL